MRSFMRIYRADSFGLFDQSVFLMALQTGFLIRVFRTFSVRTVTGSAGHAASNVAIGAELRSLGRKGRGHREEGSKNNQ